MAIVLRLDRMMADRKISLGELAGRVGIANVNLSKIKTGRVSAIRFSTLNAICAALRCQPGDILEYVEDGQEPQRTGRKTVPQSEKRGNPDEGNIGGAI